MNIDGKTDENGNRCCRVCSSVKSSGGKDDALTPLIKQLTDMALQAELETHLSQDLQRKSHFFEKDNEAWLI